MSPNVHPGTENTPEPTWRSKAIGKWWWPFARPIVNAIIMLALLFFWDPGKKGGLFNG